MRALLVKYWDFEGLIFLRVIILLLKSTVLIASVEPVLAASAIAPLAESNWFKSVGTGVFFIEDAISIIWLEKPVFRLIERDSYVIGYAGW